MVREVWGAFEHADKEFEGKYVHTGIPVRSALRALPPQEVAVERLGLSTKRRTILAMGGSQGARSINDALTSLVKSDGLPQGWQLVHVTGEKEYDRVRKMLAQDGGHDAPAVRPYLHDMTDAYAAADLVLARAGASTLGELAATGKPALLIPYPHASDDHQRANAEEFARARPCGGEAARDFGRGDRHEPPGADEGCGPAAGCDRPTCDYSRPG